MLVLCDVDGVVADLTTVWLDLYNQDYSDDLTVPEITAWDMAKFVKPECGNRIYDYLRLPHLYDNVKPIEYALEGIEALRSKGHRVVFVTSGVQPSKTTWLFKQGLVESDFFSKDVVIASDKSMIRGDVLIDDRPENCIEFHAIRYNTAILFNQPHNTFAQWPIRVDGWQEIVDMTVWLKG